MKWIYSLAGCMFLQLCVPVLLFAQDGIYDIPNTNITLTYEENDSGEVIIVDCNEDATGDLLLPAMIDGKHVREIGYSAFFVVNR